MSNREPGGQLIRQGFQYGLRLKAQKEALLRGWVGYRRFVFNEALAHQKSEVAAGRKRPCSAALCARLPALKAQRPWLGEAPAQALQQALNDLCAAWGARYTSRFDAPRFRKKGDGDTPFHADTVARFLDRAHPLLGEGGKCGLILPAYVLQTSSKVLSMSEKWSIEQGLMPRNIFPRLSVPIVLSVFTKEAHRRLFGFFLYREAAEVSALSEPARQVLERSDKAGSVWRQAVHAAFDHVSEDVAPLDALYRALEGRRPTDNAHYRAMVRQTLQAYSEFVSVDRGTWRRQPAEAVAA